VYTSFQCRTSMYYESMFYDSHKKKKSINATPDQETSFRNLFHIYTLDLVGQLLDRKNLFLRVFFQSCTQKNHPVRTLYSPGLPQHANRANRRQHSLEHFYIMNSLFMTAVDRYFTRRMLHIFCTRINPAQGEK
jgi:hypothetical protein